MKKTVSLLILLAFLVACAKNDVAEENGTQSTAESTAPTAPENADQVVITLAVEGNPSLYRPLIEQFEQEHPDIRVRLVSTRDVANPDDYSEVVRTMASSFDVFPYTLNWQDDTQYLLDLRPLLALDAQFDEDDFLPNLLPSSPQPLWIVPTGAAYQLTFFDKSAFDDANLPYPELEWTVEDFLTAALALTTREEGEVTRWGYIPVQLAVAPLLATQLIGPLGSGDALRPTDPDVVAAVQWMSDLFTLHQVSPWLESYKPTDRRSGSQSSLALINSGMAAIWNITHFVYDENVGVTAVPRGQNGFAAEPIITGFAVSRGTRSPEAAWQLLDFLSRQLPQDSIGDLVSFVPARRSVAAATNFWEQLPAELAPVLQYTVENSAPRRISNRVAASELLLKAFAAHIDNNIPVAVALAQSAEAVTTAPTPSTTELIVVQEAEPEIPEDAIQITFTSYSYLFQQQRLLAEQFQNENPGIIVNVKRPDDTPGLTHYQDLLNDNSDCFIESALALQDDQLRAAILPIGPLLEVDGSLQLDDFYLLQSSYFIEGGELLVIPAFMWTQLIEYNRDLFREASLPEPSLDWTLDDFLEIAQQMTQGEGEEKQYGYAENFEYLISFGLSSFGVAYIDDSVGVPTFNYDATAEMIAWYTDLVRLYEVQMPLTGDSIVDFELYETLLLDERVAMWGFSFIDDSLIERGLLNADIDIGVLPYPLGPSGFRGDLTSNVHGYYIKADSPYREACWQWIKFLTLQPQAIALKQTVPAHIETAESAEYIDSVGEELAAATRAFVVSSPPSSDVTTISWFFPGHDWLREAYRNVARGRSDVPTALARANVKFNQYRQCLIDRNAFDNYNSQLECAISADPALGDRYQVQPTE